MVLFLEHFLGSFCWQPNLSLSSLIDYNSYNDLASDACFLSTLYNDDCYVQQLHYSTFYIPKAIKATSKASQGGGGSCYTIIPRLQFNLPSFLAAAGQPPDIWEIQNYLLTHRKRPKAICSGQPPPFSSYYCQDCVL